MMRPMRSVWRLAATPYFDVTQAVVTVKSSPAASVKTVHQLRTLSKGEIDALVADLPTAFAVANELTTG